MFCDAQSIHACNYPYPSLYISYVCNYILKKGKKKFTYVHVFVSYQKKEKRNLQMYMYLYLYPYLYGKITFHTISD